MLNRLATLLLAAAAMTPPAAVSADGYVWDLPRGFSVPAVPADNPMSEAKVALGRRLFFEPRLSVTGEYSCASCHDPQRAFSDGRRLARGALGDELQLNTMPLVNVAYNLTFGWSAQDVRSLEAQMLQPLLNEHPVEMGLKGREAQVIATLRSDAAYAKAFADSFPNQPEVTFEHAVKAIAAFERTLIFGRSAFDRYVFDGDHQALSSSAKRGMELFFSNRTGCAGCHSGLNFAGNWRDGEGATGEPSFARNGTRASPVRVPTLRNIALTAPYMHDGRFATLDAVLQHYSQASTAREIRLPRLQLTARERRELIAFLNALSDTTHAAGLAAQTAESPNR